MENKPSIPAVPKIERDTQLESSPTVEHLSISSGVLVKVIFPVGESLAKTFMLISPPSSEKGVENIKDLLEKTTDQKERKTIEHTFEIMNSPLLFRNKEEAQRWFDFSKYTYEDATRTSVANFLEIEDKDD